MKKIALCIVLLMAALILTPWQQKTVAQSNCQDNDGDGFTQCDGDCKDNDPSIHQCSTIRAAQPLIYDPNTGCGYSFMVEKHYHCDPGQTMFPTNQCTYLGQDTYLVQDECN